MIKLQKKHFTILLLTTLISIALLLQGLFQVEQAVETGGFVFIFIAYVMLFLLIIAQEKPRLSRCVFSFQLRAPPSN